MGSSCTTHSVALALSAVLAAGGCQSAQRDGAGAAATLPPPGSPVPAELRAVEVPIRGGGAALVAIKEGAAPLFYLSEMAATLRVVDRTAGDLILAEGVVGPRTIVRVDQRTGVVFGRERQFAGPLPEGRRYAIYVVPDSENTWRVGVSQPTPASRRRAPAPSQFDEPADPNERDAAAAPGAAEQTETK